MILLNILKEITFPKSHSFIENNSIKQKQLYQFLFKAI